MEERKKIHTTPEPVNKVCLKCSNVVRTIHTSGIHCPRCGFRLVPPPEYSGWEPLDVALFRFSNTLLNVQKLTSIWTWIATEESRPEDVESVLPGEKSEAQNKLGGETVSTRRRTPSLVWWVLTMITLTIVLYVVLVGVT
jgi:hypothetical protein